MANSDKTPIKAVYNGGVPFALGEYESTDTINPYYASYDKPSNGILTADNIKDNLDIVETQLEFFNTPADSLDYFQAHTVTPQVKASSWTKLIMEVVDYDTANTYDTVNSRYYIPTKGIWKFIARAGYTYYGSGFYFSRGIDFFKNNTMLRTTYSHGFRSFTTEQDAGDINDIITSTVTAELDVGDYIDCRWQEYGTTGFNFEIGEDRFGWSGYLHRTTL